MDTSQDLSLNLTTRQRLSRQQLRFVRLLEMNPDELRDAVEAETEANPALEQEITPGESMPEIDRTEGTDINTSRGFTSWSGDRRLMKGYGSNDEDNERSFSPEDNTRSLTDYLLGQLGQFSLSDKTMAAIRYLIGSMDPNGYIYRPQSNLRQDLEFQEGVTVSDEEWEEAWQLVRHLDPPGVGATDLRDCLLIQLDRKPEDPVRDLARTILIDRYDLFIKKHIKKIASSLRKPEAEVEKAVSLIRSLDPKPGSSVADTVEDAANVIVPDFIFERGENGEMFVTLNNRFPDLRISQSFDEAVRALKTPSERKKNPFVLSNWREARDFVELLRQRQNTLMRVMSAILKIQHEYFETEDIYMLRPMIIKDVANETGLDLSVISRATANKYIETPWGIFPLRFFFSDTVGTENGEDNEALTNRKIEQEIRTVVENEDKAHPLSDEKIRETILARGYDISRRTVAKYRDRLGIPVARLRRP